MAEERKPYDFEIAKALSGLAESLDTLKRAGFDVALTQHAEQENISINVTQAVFHQTSTGAIWIEPVALDDGIATYKLSKHIGAFLDVHMIVAGEPPVNTREQEAA